MPKERAQKAIEIINGLGEGLLGIVRKVQQDNDFETARERLKRWKSRAVSEISKAISPTEGGRLEGKRKGSYLMGQPLRNFEDEANMYRGFLQSLRETIEQNPEEVLVSTADGQALSTSAIEAPAAPISRTVFIIHGRDELNLLRLEKLLRDRWGLDSVILKFEPGKGRTLIEKFEQEAQRASYAVALFTPDDVIELPTGSYTQARPNVVFELGWFYGRLSRSRVSILFKRGTKIHSDLEGIMRVEFNDSVEECATDLDKELKAAKLVPS